MLFLHSEEFTTGSRTSLHPQPVSQSVSLNRHPSPSLTLISNWNKTSHKDKSSEKKQIWFLETHNAKDLTWIINSITLVRKALGHFRKINLSVKPLVTCYSSVELNILMVQQLLSWRQESSPCSHKHSPGKNGLPLLSLEDTFRSCCLQQSQQHSKGPNHPPNQDPPISS